MPAIVLFACASLALWPSRVAGPMVAGVVAVGWMSAWRGLPARDSFNSRAGSPCHAASMWIAGIAVLGMVPVWPAWLSGRWDIGSIVTAVASAIVAVIAGRAASRWPAGGEGVRRRLAFLLGSALLVHGGLLVAFVAVAARQNPHPLLALGAIVGAGVAMPLGWAWLHERRGGRAVACWLVVVLLAIAAFRAAGGGR